MIIQTVQKALTNLMTLMAKIIFFVVNNLTLTQHSPLMKECDASNFSNEAETVKLDMDWPKLLCHWCWLSKLDNILAISLKDSMYTNTNQLIFFGFSLAVTLKFRSGSPKSKSCVDTYLVTRGLWRPWIAHLSLLHRLH